MKAPRFRPLFALSLVALGACAEASDVAAPDEDATGVSALGTATRLGELEYRALMEIPGAFGGAPLWVSNNPEDVGGFGLLSSTRPPQPAVAPRSAATGAPYPDLITADPLEWQRSQPGCPVGEVRSVHLYLAHILSSAHLRGHRRVSVLAETGETPAMLRWGGMFGTTGWSDAFGMKTTRNDWLGAKVADFRLQLVQGTQPLDKSLATSAGQLTTLASVAAESLVEGALHLESQGGCVAVHVVAHSADVASPLPTYAKGDAKWPGWLAGKGYGRAAGLYQGNTWVGATSRKISSARSAFGWKLFHAEQSPKALARHGDSAEILFGGYGVVYEARIGLSNDTSRCVSAHVAFTSYGDLAARPGKPPLGDRRTPSARSLEATDPAKWPSMIWNGPVAVRQQVRGGAWVSGREHVVLKPALGLFDGSDPLSVPASLSRPLLRWDMNPGEQREVVLQIPVPGYVIAPAAITVETSPCEP
jgi:hypothetical protein